MSKTSFLDNICYNKIGIKSIKSVVSQKTFDFEVEDDHSFLLENNIVSSNSTEFTPSISLRVTKGKIKATDLAELEYMYSGGIPKHLSALGIVARIDLYKSRFTRPFRKVQIMIPYDFGLPEYAGLFVYLKDNDIILDGVRKGYYNFKELPQDKEFSRKQFIKDGFAKMIMDHMLAQEEKGGFYDFIMKSQDDIIREKEEKKNANNYDVDDDIIDDDIDTIDTDNDIVDSDDTDNVVDSDVISEEINDSVKNKR